MKVHLLSFFLLFITGHSFSQETTDFLDLNNVEATVSNRGVFFTNHSFSTPGYRFPKFSDNHVIFAASLWFGGIDADGFIKTSAELYGTAGGGRDLYPGALTTDGEVLEGMPPQHGQLYVLSKAEINEHIAMAGTPGYVINSTILEWPAHGDTDLGYDYSIAPFADLNFNSLYEPGLGEYPIIRGDQAAFMILNDVQGGHTVSGGDPLGIEIHVMLYEYATDDYLNNTTFSHIKVINKSGTDYTEFIVGNFMDTDIGDPSNDFIGTYPENGVIFSYNAELMDNGTGGAPGYGSNVPAVGLVHLNTTMNVGGYFNSGGGPYGEPNGAISFWNYMNGRWAFGESFRFGGNGNTTAYGDETNYLFEGDPGDLGDGEWSEFSEGSIPEDRRIFSATAPTTLSNGESLCFDYAVLTTLDGGDHVANASLLIELAAEVKEFYVTESTADCDFTLSVDEEEKPYSTDLTIYPNPSEGTITIPLEGNYEMSIFTMDGRLVYNKPHYGTETLTLNLVSGNYIVVVQQNQSLRRTKITIN